ncbi:MAG: Gldg family protein [Phycisphaerales bacterium]|jgi:ABC-2 type transport system permease protein|nr:Gldg family protein [Phycisphaerales bacterium]
MKQMIALCLRDLRSLFCVATGPVVAALFACICGVAFLSGVFELGGIATMRPIFDLAAWLLILLCPAITMRLVAEERRVGTWDLLLSSPISSFHIAKGKFLAAWCFLLFVVLTTIPLVLVLELYARPDYGAIFSGYLGLLLFGGAICATGILISACTPSQTVAYLGTTFLWLTFSLSTKVLPTLLPARFADLVFMADPDLRVNAFSIGLIDSAGVVYFLSIIVVMIVVATVAVDLTRRSSLHCTKAILAVASLLASLIAVNELALHESYRVRVDATGSRTYTLSEQTSTFLSNLDSNWRIVVLMDENLTGRAIAKQVDEVLRRYEAASEFLEVDRLDPSDPESLDAFDSLLRDLMDLYSEELSAAEATIEDGKAAFKELTTFALSESAWAELASRFPVTSKEQETLQTLATSLELLGRDGDLILDEVDKAMFIDAAAPLPRLAVARDILAAANGRWATELSEVAWWLKEGRSSEFSEVAKEESLAFETMALKLAKSDDDLRRLGRLELGELASQLTQGQGAVLISPNRATMISASLLFPATNAISGITQDQRFRGEQIISSALRSLESSIVPHVVFVHAEQKSLLSKQENAVDLSAVRGLLETSRFQVHEWIPADGARPSIDHGPVVYVVIPPSSRAGLELSTREQSLLDATEGLLAGNESVLLNIQPSLLPRYGQVDPWARLLQGIGIEANTSEVVLQRIPIGPQQVHIQRGQLIDRSTSSHAIARAVNGRRLYLPLPVELRGGDVLFSIFSSPDRWLDEDWASETDGSSKSPLQYDLPVACAVVHHEEARAIAVGSGGWLLSWAADRASQSGEGHVTMANPGNSEFLLAAVEWLARLDDWIAASPLGQQTSRIHGIPQGMYFAWVFILPLGIPILILGVAGFLNVRRQTK